MNRRDNRRSAAPRRTGILCAVLALPIFLYATTGNLEALHRAGQQMAMVSAALQMPDSGMALLEQRFRSELYGNWDKDTHGISPPSQAADSESPAAKEESGAAREETGSQIRPNIPEKYAAPIISEDFSGRNNENMLPFLSGLVKNETTHEDGDVLAILEKGMPISFADTPEPQVLIVHTHATESFEQYDTEIYDTRNTWRSTDNNRNMVALGNAMAEVLEENGIGVIHDTTQHDYPSYNGSYERSAKTVKAYLEEYPTIKVVLDLHRDAMQRDDAIVKPVANIDGKKASQVMIIAGCDDGTMDMPDWRENLRFAGQLQEYIESQNPGLTRPIYFCYRKYNQDLTTGSLLIEFGSNANTLEEGVCAARLTGQALADLINDNKE